MRVKQDRDKNRRQNLRRRSFIIVEYTVKEGVFRDIIKNIGANGIFIGTSRRVAEGQDVLMKFPLFQFDHQIQARGKVARSGPNGIAVSFDDPIAALICKEGEFPDIVHESDR